MSARQILKITLLGDGAVGKTSIRNRYMGRGFKESHLMTIGADFAAVDKTVKYNDKDYHVTFQIWDLAGQARFTEVRQRFYFGSLGGLLLFDITRPESFSNIPNWLNEIWKNSGTGAVPIVLIGNKSDLRSGWERLKSDILTISKLTTESDFTWDYVFVGAGIFGVSTAKSLLERKPDSKILLIDKYSASGQGNTVNSNVLHATIKCESHN